MAVSSVGEYLSALEKSKLLRSEQLVEAQRLAGESSDAETLAKALARDNLVSRWQAGTLLALGQRAQLRLGKYKLIQRLGKGGMGTVFLAEHVTMNRRVALKVVPRSIAEDRASLDRFFAEARAIAALDHPNIVQAYSVDNEMDRYFIVMEFVDGQDLQRMVEVNGPLDFDQAAEYVRQAADGLAHAHARNLVHCDIKPSNLLVNPQGVIKILDLGLARLNRSDEPRGAAAGEPAFGTVDYMAPEQALETANFNHRADIYSLGCTLYFLLTGHPPFPEGTLAQRIVKHQTQEPRDLSLERPGTPPSLIEICKRMMAKEPEDRCQSMQEVSAALAPFQHAGNAVGAPRAVKPLEDSPADDLFSFLAASASNAKSNGAKTPAPAAGTTSPAKSAKPAKQDAKARSGGGIAPALAGVLAFGRTRLGWFNTTKRKIVGAIGGTVLLAAAAGLAAWPFLPSRPKPPPVTVQQKAEENKAPIEEPVGPPPDKSLDKKSDISQRLPEKKAPAGKTEAVSTATSPPPQPEKSPPSKPAEPEKTTPKAVAKPEVPSATKPDAKPEPNSTAKADVKPTTPDKKPETPAKPPETAKTVAFDGLAAAVDLPQVGKGPGDAASLGKLDLDPKLTVAVQLLGGEIVAKGNPKFELQAEGDSAAAAWSVEMLEKNKDPVKIARVWREASEWKVQWTAEAKNKATLFRYCGLQFSCEKKTHITALITPKTVAPLPIEFDAGAARVRLSKDFPMPDFAALRLQILPLDKALPKTDIMILDAKAHAGRPQRGRPSEPTPVPGNTVPVKGHVIVVLTKENTPRVKFEIAFEARAKDVQLDMQAACEIAGRSAPCNYSSLQMANANVNTFLAKFDQDKNPLKKNMQTQIDAAKATRDHLKALSELTASLNHKASIPFRVYMALRENADETAPKIVLFESGEMEKPKAAAVKKAPKGKEPKGRPAPDSNNSDVDLK